MTSGNPENYTTLTDVTIDGLFETANRIGLSAIVASTWPWIIIATVTSIPTLAYLR